MKKVEELSTECIEIVNQFYKNSNVVVVMSAHKDELFSNKIRMINNDIQHSYHAAVLLIGNIDPESRFVGYSIFQDALNPTDERNLELATNIVNLLLKTLPSEHDVSCLHVVAQSLGFSNLPSTEDALLGLTRHPNSDIRSAATGALGFIYSESPSRAWRKRMSELLRDTDKDVREWAKLNIEFYINH